MIPKDTVTEDVTRICDINRQGTLHNELESLTDINNILDDIFANFEQNYLDGYDNRRLKIAEKAKIIDAVCTNYSVKNTNKAQMKDIMFEEYLDEIHLK